MQNYLNLQDFYVALGYNLVDNILKNVNLALSPNTKVRSC